VVREAVASPSESADAGRDEEPALVPRRPTGALTHRVGPRRGFEVPVGHAEGVRPRPYRSAPSPDVNRNVSGGTLHPPAAPPCHSSGPGDLHRGGRHRHHGPSSGRGVRARVRQGMGGDRPPTGAGGGGGGGQRARDTGSVRPSVSSHIAPLSPDDPSEPGGYGRPPAQGAAGSPTRPDRTAKPLGAFERRRTFVTTVPAGRSPGPSPCARPARRRSGTRRPPGVGQAPMARTGHTRFTLRPGATGGRQTHRPRNPCRRAAPHLRPSAARGPRPRRRPAAESTLR
jgi:hypothetical protein